MSRIKQLMSAFLLLSMLPSAGGCVWVAAGVGAGSGVAYYKGELKKVEPVAMDTMWRASLKGARAARLVVISSDRHKAEIIARTRTDKKVTIQLKSIAARETEISIRVGTFGDQELSVVILERIKQYLK